MKPTSSDGFSRPSCAQPRSPLRLARSFVSRLETSLRVVSALLILAAFCVSLILVEILVVVVGAAAGARHRVRPASRRSRA
jgi:hypothetical protein